MMKRIFLIILVTALCATIFCGCTTKAVENIPATTSCEEEVFSEFAFEKVYSDTGVVGGNSRVEIYRELTTDVLYMKVYQYSGYGGGPSMVVMLNPETGLPLTYSKWQESYKK